MPMLVAENLPGKQFNVHEKKLESVMAVAEVKSTSSY